MSILAPSVSIVVPVLNEAPRVEAALTRLRRDFGECELVVVDGGSSDGTAGLAGRFAPVLTSEPGRAAQMNAGARASSGEVVWFIHADAVIEPAALAQVREAMADSSVVGGGLSLRFDARSPSLDLLARASNGRARRLHQVFGDQAMFVRRSVFEALGGFPALAIMEDLEMSRRLHRRGRLVLLNATSTASARRFTEHGTLPMIAFMQYLKLLYLAGVPSERIRRRYEAGPVPQLSRRRKASVTGPREGDPQCRTS